MNRHHSTTLVFVLSLTAFTGVLTGSLRATPPADADAAATAVRVERGAYLVRTMGCHDCHTPWKLGPRGPEPDMSRALTGHPAETIMPPPPALPPGPWTWLGAAT